jgi:integrase
MPRPRLERLHHNHHKATGRGFVRLHGKVVYTGVWGTREAEDRYTVLAGQWVAEGRPAAPAGRNPKDAGPLTIGELVQLYVVRHVMVYYRDAEGRASPESRNIIRAMQLLKRVVGNEPAAGFTPARMKEWRMALSRGLHAEPGTLGSEGLCRNRINREGQRVRQLFAWAVEAELVPASVYYALLAVKPLARGRWGVTESEPVQAVEDDQIARTLPFLTPVVRDMLLLQRLTGMRSGEICAMTTGQIDTSDEGCWIYRPGRHKTAFRGHLREVPLVAAAQAILRPYLHPDDLEHPLFTGSASKAAGRERRRTARVTHHRSTDACRTGPETGETPPAAFDVHAYARAIHRASLLALMPAELRVTGRKLSREQRRELAGRRREWMAANASKSFHPHQVRHTVARAGTRAGGAENARNLLGHKTLSMTLRYAGQSQQSAVEGARAVAGDARALLAMARPAGLRLAK